MTKNDDKTSKNTSKNPASDQASEASGRPPFDDKVTQIMQQDRAEKARFKHLLIDFKENRFGPLVFAVMFAGLGCFFVFRSSAAPESAQPIAEVRMWVVTQPKEVVNGQTATAEIWIDAGSQQVNAAQANLKYPTDRLQYEGVDSSKSDFGIDAEATHSGGKIQVVRGTINPVSGKHLLTKVTFKAQAHGSAKIELTDQSAIVSSTSNKNVLSGRAAGEFDVTN